MPSFPALRVRTPTDHLARLLGYVGEIAKRPEFALFIDELQDVRDGLPEREGDAVLGLLRSELQRLRIPCFFAGRWPQRPRGQRKECAEPQLLQCR